MHQPIRQWRTRVATSHTLPYARRRVNTHTASERTHNTKTPLHIHTRIRRACVQRHAVGVGYPLEKEEVDEDKHDDGDVNPHGANADGAALVGRAPILLRARENVEDNVVDEDEDNRNDRGLHLRESRLDLANVATGSLRLHVGVLHRPNEDAAHDGRDDHECHAVADPHHVAHHGAVEVRVDVRPVVLRHPVVRRAVPRGEGHLNDKDGRAIREADGVDHVRAAEDLVEPRVVLNLDQHAHEATRVKHHRGESHRPAPFKREFARQYVRWYLKVVGSYEGTVDTARNAEEHQEPEKAFDGLNFALLREKSELHHSLTVEQVESHDDREHKVHDRARNVEVDVVRVVLDAIAVRGGDLDRNAPVAKGDGGMRRNVRKLDAVQPGLAQRSALELQ
eukprot:Opistho-1_new@88376